MSQLNIDLSKIQSTWIAFDQATHLRPIRTEEEYDRTVILMNALLDVIGDQDDHPLAGLLDLVSEMVEDFDEEHYAIS